MRVATTRDAGTRLIVVRNARTGSMLDSKLLVTSVTITAAETQKAKVKLTAILKTHKTDRHGTSVLIQKCFQPRPFENNYTNTEFLTI